MAPELDLFRKQFSSVRMGSFELAAGSDPELAIRLYDWNIQIGGAVWEDLSVVEVLMRTAFDRVLQDRFDPEPWYGVNAALWSEHYSFRDEAIRIARHDEGIDEDDRTDPSHDSVVAAMPFGIWRLFASKKYEDRVWSTLQRAFRVSRLNRTLFEPRIVDLSDLRNDIAHHRPVFGWDFDNSYSNIKMIAGVISPEVQVWITDRSRLPDMLRDDPLGRPWKSARNA